MLLFLLLQLDEVLQERRQELKANHQNQLERLRQEQDTELRRMQLEMQEKVSVAQHSVLNLDFIFGVWRLLFSKPS